MMDYREARVCIYIARGSPNSGRVTLHFACTFSSQKTTITTAITTTTTTTTVTAKLSWLRVSSCTLHWENLKLVHGESWGSIFSRFHFDNLIHALLLAVRKVWKTIFLICTLHRCEIFETLILLTRLDTSKVLFLNFPFKASTRWWIFFSKPCAFNHLNQWLKFENKICYRL